ncbi:MAG: ribosome silencing factor [Proteobacteria bacterium]|nr:ribosome silencing factor [Pseudomonadota bacterium]
MPKDKVQKAKATENSKKKLCCCVQAASDQKGEDLVALDVTKISSFADYFIICHGQSGRQVRGIARHIKEKLGKAGFEPVGIEGSAEGEWILMDYNDVIIHVFHKSIREFYDLERLWNEAPRIDTIDKKTIKS